ncbi:AAA family ATPase [Leifsonia sp. RAF41]|uniref:AAA family ATPase n=1 Tax=Leifsonia sp. RAF41 TaxID=3233056 RepID=UPI003F9C5822
MTLVGRAGELAALEELIADTQKAQGRSILIRGDAGIGKSALAWEVERAAKAEGFTVLRCAGVRSGSLAGYAGLHDLLRPLFGGLGDLPDRQRAALEISFGRREGDSPDRLLIGLATMGLLEEASTTSPTLLLVEDLHWLDTSTAAVVAFVAARLGGLSASLVATTRVDPAYPDWESAFTTSLTPAPLDDDTSRALVLDHTPGLDDTLMGLILEQARGNPLALAELSAIVPDDAVSLSSTKRLPTTRRIESTFLAEVGLLPEATRSALLIAAAGEDAPYDEIVAAIRSAGGSEHDLIPAERFHLLQVQNNAFVFRHPLISSSLYESAGTLEKANAHQALAGAAKDAGRAARHRASGTLGFDEDVAAEIEATAIAAAQQGAWVEATGAWRRAATLSPSPDDRARRLVAAADSARQAAAPGEAADLVGQAKPIATDPELIWQIAQTEWMLSVTAVYRGPSTAELVTLAQGQPNAAKGLEMLVWAAATCYLQGQTLDVRRTVHEQLESVPDGVDDVLRSVGFALADPQVRFDDPTVALKRFEGKVSESDGHLLNLLAFATENSNMQTAESVWSAAVELYRNLGQVANEAAGLCGRGVVRAVLGRLDLAVMDLEQSIQISQDLNLGVVLAMGLAGLARVQAMQGYRERTQETLDRLRLRPEGEVVARIAAMGAWASGLLALQHGRFAEAFAELQGTSANPPIALWAGADLVEAAAGSQQGHLVSDWVTLAETTAESADSDHLRMLVHRARALLSYGDEAHQHFELSIEYGARTEARVDVARSQLLFGEWLRRERRIREARSHLANAKRGFEEAGAAILATRAAAELRAAGVANVDTSFEEQAEMSRSLTAQELLAAQLAATGLTNKEIADRLYLSPRTVGAHLHRAFAKLGISRRSQLQQAIGGVGRLAS